MSDKQERRDLAIIVTRLSAVRGAHDDEFLEDWDSSGAQDFIALNPTGEGGPWTALILHGHRELFGRSSPKLVEEVVSANLKKAGIDHSCFTHVWLFVHGSLPDGHRLDENASPSILGEVAKGKQFHARSYSGEGQPSAFLGLVKALQRESSELDDLLNLIREKSKLRPVVETTAREMQHLILEFRLLLDIVRTLHDSFKSVMGRLEEVATLLEDDKHLNAPHMKKVLTSLLGNQGTTWTLETLTYAASPEYKSNLNDEILAFLTPYHVGGYIQWQLRTYDGRLASLEELLKINDEVIRACAARLDVAIECASKMDEGR